MFVLRPTSCCQEVFPPANDIYMRDAANAVMEFIEGPSIGAHRVTDLALLKETLAISPVLPDIGIAPRVLLRRAIRHDAPAAPRPDFVSLEAWMQTVRSL